MLRVDEGDMHDPDELPGELPSPVGDARQEPHGERLVAVLGPGDGRERLEDPPEFIPFKETPGPYSSMFDDNAKIFKAEQRKERAELTRQKQAELRKRPHDEHG